MPRHTLSFGAWTSDRDFKVAVVLSMAWYSVTLATYWNHPAPDLAALYFAGYFFDNAQHSLVYAADPFFFSHTLMPAEWTAAIETVGYKGTSIFPFVYPPVWAAIFAPIAASFSPSAVFNVFYIIQIAMLPAMLFMAWDIAGRRIPLTLLLVLGAVFLNISNFDQHLLPNNQPAILVTFGILLWMKLSMLGWNRTGVLVLAFITALKIYPVVLVLSYVLYRNYRALTQFCLLMTIILASSVGLVGVDLHFEFLERLRSISETTFIVPIVYSLKGSLSQIIPAFNDFVRGQIPISAAGSPQYIMQTYRIIEILNILFFAVGAVWLVRNWHKCSKQWRDFNFPLGLITLSAICGPLGWSYHYLPVLCFLPFLWPSAQIYRQLSFVFIVMMPWLAPTLYFSLPPSWINWPQIFGTLSVAAIFMLLIAKDPPMRKNKGRKLGKALPIISLKVSSLALPEPLD